MVHSRRDFLKRGMFVIPVAATMPGVFVRAAFGGTGSSTKNLILLELEGGNDGLNLVVPYGVNGGAYYSEFRPTIGIPANSVLQLNGSIGLNPSCLKLKQRYDAGQVAIVNGVGYPQQNFSHEIAQQIWAKGDPSLLSPTGWLARLLNQFPAASFPNSMTAEDGTERAYQGINEFSPAFGWLGAFDFPYDYDHWEDQGNVRAAYEAIVTAQTQAAGSIGTMSSTSKSLLQLIDTINAMPNLNYAGTYTDDYFGDRLKMIARLMNANLGLHVFHVTQWGFDTHSEQETDAYHSTLLGDVFNSVDALMVDLAAMGKLQDTVIVVYSEFGRTVYENGSGGTDHGTINPVIVVGGGVNGGVKNAHAPMDPNQLDENGELPRQADFRDIFGEIGSKLFGVTKASLFPGYTPAQTYGVLP